MIRTEVCVESTLGARAAAQGGADRIELCDFSTRPQIYP